jgi:hypothetical protein
MIGKREEIREAMVEITFGANVGQFDATGCDELECFVHVLRLLHTHARIPVVASKGSITCTYRVCSWFGELKTVDATYP